MEDDFNYGSFLEDLGDRKNLTQEDAMAELYGDEDRIRDRIESRRAIMQAQAKSDEIKAALCNKIQAEKAKSPSMNGLSLQERILALEKTDPDMFKFIRKLEYIQEGIWCPTCNKQKTVGLPQMQTQQIPSLDYRKPEDLEKLRELYPGFYKNSASSTETSKSSPDCTKRSAVTVCCSTGDCDVTTNGSHSNAMFQAFSEQMEALRHDYTIIEDNLEELLKKTRAVKADFVAKMSEANSVANNLESKILQLQAAMENMMLSRNAPYRGNDPRNDMICWPADDDDTGRPASGFANEKPTYSRTLSSKQNTTTAPDNNSWKKEKLPPSLSSNASLELELSNLVDNAYSADSVNTLSADDLLM